MTYHHPGHSIITTKYKSAKNEDNDMKLPGWERDGEVSCQGLMLK